MEDQTMIRILLLLTNEYIISQIEEVGSELGEPDCKLISPYQIVNGELVKWCEEYTDQDEVMIHSDKILTLVEPNEKYFDMYSEAIGGFK